MLLSFVLILPFLGQSAAIKPYEYKNLNVESCAVLKGKGTVVARQYLERQGTQPDDPVCTIAAMMILSLDPHEEDVSLLAQRLDWVAPVDQSGAKNLLGGEDDYVPAIPALGRYGQSALPSMYGIAASSTASPRAARSAVLVIREVFAETGTADCKKNTTAIADSALRDSSKRGSLATDLGDAARACSVASASVE